MVPASSGCWPRIARSRLVLPDPFAPSTATNSPGFDGQIEPAPQRALAEREARVTDLECGGHWPRAALTAIDVRRHPGEVGLAGRQQLGELDDRHASILGGIPHPLGLASWRSGSCSRAGHGSALDEVEHLLQRGGWHVAALLDRLGEGGGDASESPNASSRYRGTGSVSAASPATCGIDAARASSSPAARVALSTYWSTPSGSRAMSASAIVLDERAHRGMSYQTCSLGAEDLTRRTRSARIASVPDASIRSSMKGRSHHRSR